MSIAISQLVTGAVNGNVELPGTNPLDTTSGINGTTYKYLVSDVLQYMLSAQGFTTYQSCVAASTASLTATYANGTLGVGATLTNSGAQSALTLDGVTLKVNDRVLIKDQTASEENGIYVVTTVGSSTVNWVLTRAQDFNEAAKVIYLGVVLITQGTTQQGVIYQEASQGPFTIGTSPITFQVLNIGTNLLPSASPADKVLRSDGTNWLPSAATYPNSTSINQILYSSANDVISEIPTANSAILVTDSSGTPGFTGSMIDGQVLIGSTGATPVLAKLTQGSNITITNAPGSITISSSGGAGLAWTEITGTSQTISANNGYVSSNASLVTLTLPATAGFGTVISVQGKGAGGWKIAQNAGQQIHFGNVDTTSGTSGYLASTNQYDSVQLLCITANTDWAVISAQGAIGYN